MPISCAAPISSETARIAFPSFVFWTRSVNATIAMTATMMVKIAV